jgi:hypothetical protein
VAQQLTQAFGQNAPGAFAFTTFATETDALAAVDRRDVDAALVVGPCRIAPRRRGSAGDAIAGGITAAFTGAFRRRGAELQVEVVHPYSAGDPHGIVLFFLLLATLVSSVVAGALAALGTTDRSWTVPARHRRGLRGERRRRRHARGGLARGRLRRWLARRDGGRRAALVRGRDRGRRARRLLGPAGVAIGALVVVFLGLVSSGGPLGTAFLPDAYRAIAPWLPVAPAADALRGALFFGGSGLAAPLLVVAGWAILGVAVLAARDLFAPASRRAELATA